mgnify:CR=1 FL=1|jgi:hypothetical protein
MTTKRKTEAKLVIPENYDLLERASQYGDNISRYKDFSNLFFGTPQGLRVFKEILGMGYMLNDPIKYNKYGVDDKATLISTGERKLALAIHKVTTVEPPPPPPPTSKSRRDK